VIGMDLAPSRRPATISGRNYPGRTTERGLSPDAYRAFPKSEATGVQKGLPDRNKGDSLFGTPIVSASVKKGLDYRDLAVAAATRSYRRISD